MHFRHCVVELHVFFPDSAAVLDGFDTFLDVVRLDGSRVNRGLGDEEDGGAGEVGLFINQSVFVGDLDSLKGRTGDAYGKLRTHDDGFDCWD